MLSNTHKKSREMKSGFSTVQKFIIVAFVVSGIGAAYFGFRALGETQVGLTLRSQQVLEDGLLLHWTFDGKDMDFSQASAEVRDSSGQGNHGDLLGN
jgi:hypothetical protein